MTELSSYWTTVVRAAALFWIFLSWIPFLRMQEAVNPLIIELGHTRASLLLKIVWFTTMGIATAVLMVCS